MFRRRKGPTITMGAGSLEGASGCPALVFLAVAGVIIGAGSRIVTAGVIGANIGGGSSYSSASHSSPGSSSVPS
jgi:hypothetical protein